MSDKITYYRKNRGIMLNRAKEYYENKKGKIKKASKKEYFENKKERLKKQARGKYRRLSEENIYIKKEYGRNRYKNMSEENEQRLKEYQSNCLRAKKNIKNVFLFVFTWYKMEQKMVFREDFINKSSSH